MKRFISALAFCISLLLLLSAFLLKGVEAAKKNPLVTLLNSPAPPPPNPLLTGLGRIRDPKFYNKNKPPKDDAPIHELLEYWIGMNNLIRKIGYNPKPSEKSAERILAEIEKNPKLLSQLLGVLPDGKRSADLVKDLYDREGTSGVFAREDRIGIKNWMTYHTPFFSNDLARQAERAGETTEHVSNQEE